MPELNIDQLVTLPPQEASPVSRIITRIKEAVHRHTPEGRREEYREKWSHVLEGTKGLPRFEIERRLTVETDKYARDRVLQDVFIAAVATAGVGLGIGGIVAWNNQPRIQELFQKYGAKIKTWTEQTIKHSAESAVKSVLSGAVDAIKSTDHVQILATEATRQGAAGVAAAVADQTVKLSVAETAFDLTHAALTGADGAVKTYASAAPNNALSRVLSFLSNLLSGTKDKTK
ncbi:MAG: hypothetical protein Q8L37_00240 [Candidatus Gottesmanbacteria bacterium]|nr:hypothetical protein [Candidatus Gottesmanbacteria bacterium]